MPSLVSLWNEVWEMSTEILHMSLPRSGLCFRLVTLHGKFALTNQKHYPDLGNDTSSEYEISVLVSQMSFHSETSGSVAKSWLFSQASYLPAIILCLAGSGVVTRRPLILQLVHTPPRATTSSKRSSKGIKPKSVEDEDGDSCEKWALHLLLIMTLQNFGCKIIVTNPNKNIITPLCFCTTSTCRLPKRYYIW